MGTNDTVIAVFTDHHAAETTVKQLTAAGFEMKNLSVVGKGYRTEEKVVGFYNVGDRIKFWGTRGAFWGGLWGLFFGGLFMVIPVVGHVIVLGYLAVVALSGIESAVVVGGLSALGAALYSVGVPKDSVLQYAGCGESRRLSGDGARHSSGNGARQGDPRDGQPLTPRSAQGCESRGADRPFRRCRRLTAPSRSPRNL